MDSAYWLKRKSWQKCLQTFTNYQWPAGGDTTGFKIYLSLWLNDPTSHWIYHLINTFPDEFIVFDRWLVRIEAKHSADPVVSNYGQFWFWKLKIATAEMSNWRLQNSQAYVTVGFHF